MKKIYSYFKEKSIKDQIIVGIVVFIISSTVLFIVESIKEHKIEKARIEKIKKNKPLKNIIINENKTTISYSNNYILYNKGKIYIKNFSASSTQNGYSYFAFISLPIKVSQGTIKNIRYYYLYDDESCSINNEECYNQLLKSDKGEILKKSNYKYYFKFKLDYFSRIKNVNKDIYVVIRDTHDNIVIYNTFLKLEPIFYYETPPIIFKDQSTQKEAIIQNNVTGKLFVNNVQIRWDMPKKDLANSEKEIIRINNILKNRFKK